jgi:hypothetical protein
MRLLSSAAGGIAGAEAHSVAVVVLLVVLGEHLEVEVVVQHVAVHDMELPEHLGIGKMIPRMMICG